jgi:hypothetical protein
MRRKKPQFNAPPVGGPIPKPASGESLLAKVIAPLVDPPSKLLKRWETAHGKNSEEYDKCYRDWYSEMIHGLGSRVITMWRNFSVPNSSLVKSSALKLAEANEEETRKGRTGHRNSNQSLLNKMLNESDAMSIWLLKSQRQFCGYPLVADCKDSSVKGFLKSKIDPFIAHENWDDVFFKHSPYTEFRFLDGGLPSLIIGTQHDKVDGTSLVVLADTYNHRDTCCLKFESPKALEQFLSGEVYLRSLAFLEYRGDDVKSIQYNGDNWCYPEISGGLHRKASLNVTGPAWTHGMVVPYLSKDVLNSLATEMEARGYNPTRLKEWWDFEQKRAKEGWEYSFWEVKALVRQTKAGTKDDEKKADLKAAVNRIMSEVVPDSEELDDIVAAVFPVGRTFESRHSLGIETQKEIRKALWVTLAILRDASKEVIHITQPKEGLEGEEKSPDNDKNGKAKEDYVPPSVRWKTIPLRIKLGPPKEGTKGVGKGVPKSPHHRKGGEVNYTHERYSASGLKGTKGWRGEAKVKGFDGDAPMEALLYSGSPEARQMAKDILAKDKARAAEKKAWLKKEAAKKEEKPVQKTEEKPVQKPVQKPVKKPVIDIVEKPKSFVTKTTEEPVNEPTAPVAVATPPVAKKTAEKSVRDVERIVETKRGISLVDKLVNLVRSILGK